MPAQRLLPPRSQAADAPRRLRPRQPCSEPASRRRRGKPRCPQRHRGARRCSVPPRSAPPPDPASRPLSAPCWVPEEGVGHQPGTPPRAGQRRPSRLRGRQGVEEQPPFTTLLEKREGGGGCSRATRVTSEPSGKSCLSPSKRLFGESRGLVKPLPQRMALPLLSWAWTSPTAPGQAASRKLCLPTHAQGSLLREKAAQGQPSSSHSFCKAVGETMLWAQKQWHRSLSPK